MRETNNLVFHKPKVVLMVACKAANTSIKTSLHGGGFACHPRGIYFGFEHWTAEQVAMASDYKRIAILRHPASRILSVWHQKVCQGGKADLLKRHSIEPNTPWPEFMERVFRLTDKEADQHIRSQCYDRFYRGRYLPQITYKLENPSATWWPELRKIMGGDLPEELPVRNVSNAPIWREFIKQAEMDKIAIRFQADLALGGYAL